MKAIMRLSRWIKPITDDILFHFFVRHLYYVVLKTFKNSFYIPTPKYLYDIMIAFPLET